MQLAKYIGVFSTPENAGRGGGPEAVAMTTPVVSSPEAISMTTPVVSSKDAENSSRSVMKFVLPSKYQSAEDAPVPTNPNIKVAVIPPQDMAVIQFSGWCDDSS